MHIPALVIRISAAVLMAAALSGALAAEPGASGIPDVTGLPAMPKGRPSGVYQHRALSGLPDGSFGVPDTLELLVILVSYNDLDFTSPPHDSLYFANELRHTWEYFRGASNGVFGLGWDIAAGITTLTFEAAYYGEDDFWEERVSEILMEAVAKNDDVIDFSRYDAFALLHAGAGQETDFAGDSSWQLWSGFIDPAEMMAVLADTLGTPGVPTNDLVDGDTFYVDNVMVLPENASQDGMIFGSLGIYAYQVGMRLGMIPMYDTTPSGYPDSQGIGAFGLMGYGLYNASGFIPAFPCTFHRYLMGWVEPDGIEADGHVDITDINRHTTADTSLVRIEISPTEYYLVSNRVHDGNMNGRFDFGDVNGNGIPENEDTLLGAEFDFFLTATTNPSHYEDIGGEQVKIVDTGSGIMIWHIDETIIRNQLGIDRYPNDNPGISGVDLEEADGVQDLDRPGGSHAFGSWGDSYRDGWYSQFNNETIPSSLANTGTRTGLEIATGSVPGEIMRISIGFGEGLSRVTGEINGTVMNIPPVAVQLDGDTEDEIIQAADTGMIYIAWDAGEEAWDGSADLVIDIAGAAWSGTPIAVDLDGAPPMEILAGSRDGRIHAYRTDGSPYPIDTGPSPGSLDVRGGIVSMPMGFEADGDAGTEAVFLVSNGDTTWMYLIGHAHADELTGGFITGEDVFGMVISPGGTAVTHPVLCVDERSPDSGGFYAVVAGPNGSLRFIHTVISHVVPGMSIASWSMNGIYGPGDLLLPASGDIDGNGTDDMVLVIPGGDLLYIDVARGIEVSSLRLEGPSPPSLADIDDDGVLETVIRDREGLYLLTGFGTPVTGWPVRLQDHIVMLEPDTVPAQPAVADVDGDGKLEVVFNVAGELRAYRYGASLEEGWPIFGEGDHSITPALFQGAGSKMFIFTAGGSGGIAAPDETGMDFFPGVSTLTRIDPGSPWDDAGAWPGFRMDALGTSRQARTEGGEEGGPLVDGNSMMCYPNPATGNLFTLRMNISGQADVTIRLFNLEGTEVYSSTTRHEWSGNGVPFEATVSTGGLASGIYLCHVHVRNENDDWSGSRKVAILK